MKKSTLELTVGIFLLAGFISFAWLSVKMGDINPELDAGEYEAVVHLNIDKTVALTDDSIASIRTAGIIGNKFIKLTPGGSEIFLEAGDEIDETESSISIEELVSKYIFESDE